MANHHNDPGVAHWDATDAHPDERPIPRLARLSDLADFELADGEEDIRGWDVYSADGKKVGEVFSLIADPTVLKVRYLEVSIDKDVVNADDDRRILVPIGMAGRVSDRNVITLSSLRADDLRTVPAYDGRPVTRDTEDAVRRYFAHGANTAYPDVENQRGHADYYAHSFFDDTRMFRGGDAGRRSESYLTRQPRR